MNDHVAERSDEQRPALISVVMPVRNGEAHISDQLAALAGQSYRGAWELIVVDNGCRDRSIAIAENFRERLPSLVVVDAPRRGLGRARNAGACAASGELVAFCDADDVATPYWLAALAAGAMQADIVGGSNDFAALNSDLQRTWARARAPMTELNSGYGFMRYPSGGNCAMWTGVARQIGWDERFAFGASDIEFGWRAQLAGYRIAFVPEAVMQIRLRGDPVSIGRQHFRYGMAEPYLFRRFRGHGMPPGDSAEALKTWRWLARNSMNHLRTLEQRGNWLRLAGRSFGRLYGSARWRIVYL